LEGEQKSPLRLGGISVEGKNGKTKADGEVKLPSIPLSSAFGKA